MNLLPEECDEYTTEGLYCQAVPDGPRSRAAVDFHGHSVAAARAELLSEGYKITSVLSDPRP